MFTSNHNTAVPAPLEQLLKQDSGSTFCLKAVLVKDVMTQNWALLGAVVRPAAGAAAERSVRRYPRALLASLPMTAQEVLDLLSSIPQGLIDLLEEPFTFVPPQSSSSIQVSIENYWMEEAGVVHDIRVHQQINVSHQDRFVAVDQPYYPDAFEAARHWLGLREHHGSSDANLGHLVVLVPETRAYFKELCWKDDKLEVAVGGSLSASNAMRVSGACWTGKSISHLASPLPDGRAVLEIPERAERLELLLVDEEGVVYDFHKEEVGYSSGNRSLLAGRSSGDSDSAVLKDVHAGEGLRTEFKEFLDIPKSANAPGAKDKLQQVLKTVAAFANTEGGTIYFGVSDDCQIVGTADHVAKWAGAKADLAAIERYMGALRAKVHDAAYPAVNIETRATYHNDLLVIALEVKTSGATVSLQHDQRIFERRGSSNIAVAPSDWKAKELPMFGQ